MTTDHRCELLRQWINELDGQIGMLGEQRDMLRSTLGVLDGSAFDVEPEPPKTGGRPPAQVPSDKALESRRAADRERKKVERRRNKTGSPKPRPGGSKYDYSEVARVARSAHDKGQPLAATVAARYDVSTAMGSYLIKEARKRGFEVPERAIKKSATNVTPLLPVAEIETVEHPAAGRRGPDPGARSFTPDDTLRLLQGG